MTRSKRFVIEWNDPRGVVITDGDCDRPLVGIGDMCAKLNELHEACRAAVFEGERRIAKLEASLNEIADTASQLRRMLDERDDRIDVLVHDLDAVERRRAALEERLSDAEQAASAAYDRTVRMCAERDLRIDELTVDVANLEDERDRSKYVAANRRPCPAACDGCEASWRQDAAEKDARAKALEDRLDAIRRIAGGES